MFYISLSYICIYIDVLNRIDDVKYNFDKNNSVSYNTRRNRKTDLTEYYNLIYEYLTDCISLNLNYNKTFYSDGNSEPDSTLSFLIKIIPFTELGVPNIGNVINR